jgi:hypothetical protein
MRAGLLSSGSSAQSRVISHVAQLVNTCVQAQASTQTQTQRVMTRETVNVVVRARVTTTPIQAWMREVALAGTEDQARGRMKAVYIQTVMKWKKMATVHHLVETCAYTDILNELESCGDGEGDGMGEQECENWT